MFIKSHWSQGVLWSVKMKSRPKLIMLVIDVEELQAKDGTKMYLKTGVKIRLYYIIEVPFLNDLH